VGIIDGRIGDDESSMLTVIAFYRCKPGRAEEIAAILADHVAATRSEPGCITFLANRSRDEPDRYVLYEQYEDEAAFEAHRESAHFARYIDNGVVPLLAERTWHRFDLVEPTAR
jgi:autoinducer 2-degrading protein